MTRTHTITNGADIIDSRDVIARIAELESERDGFAPDDIDPGEAPHTWESEHADDAEELAALLALQEDAEGYSDWRHGAGLIRDSYFTTYAKDLAEEIGAIDKSAGWPARCIDWEEAADELKQDYTAVEFDGVTYWVRS